MRRDSQGVQADEQSPTEAPSLCTAPRAPPRRLRWVCFSTGPGSLSICKSLGLNMLSKICERKKRRGLHKGEMGFKEEAF